jgi:hypothetical protein
MSASKSVQSSDAAAEIVARARRAQEEILELQKELALGDPLAPVARQHFAIWTRMPLASFTEALALHAKYGARVGDFDAEAVREAVAYEQAVAPLLDAINAFARLLADSIVERRAKIGKQPFGLLLALRAAVRYGGDANVQRDVDQLERLIVKKRPASSKKRTTAAVPTDANGAPSGAAGHESR